MNNLKLCGMCNNPAIGKGRLPPGDAHIYVCKLHINKIVEFKPIEGEVIKESE
jgi:hypothetical protein